MEAPNVSKNVIQSKQVITTPLPSSFGCTMNHNEWTAPFRPLKGVRQKKSEVQF